MTEALDPLAFAARTARERGGHASDPAVRALHELARVHHALPRTTYPRRPAARAVQERIDDAFFRGLVLGAGITLVAVTGAGGLALVWLV